MVISISSGIINVELRLNRLRFQNTPIPSNCFIVDIAEPDQPVVCYPQNEIWKPCKHHTNIRARKRVKNYCRLNLNINVAGTGEKDHTERPEFI